MSEEAKLTILRTFRRPTGEEIRVCLKTFHGKTYLDFRSWWLPDDEEAYKPTKRGVTLHAEYLPDLLAALQQAAEELGVDLGTPARDADG
jgi:hypothetical protein